MASDLFTKIELKANRAGIYARNTKKSREWFIRNLKNIRNVSRKSILTDNLLIQRNKPLIGRMFFYFYDPKTKETLPYYDTFPLIIMIGPAQGGFYGLNLHYLSPRLRAIFFDKLLEYTNNTKMDSSTRIKLTYNMLSSVAKLREFQPCFKRYLFEHMASKTVEVPPQQWETALFLPTESFQGASQQKVWRKSKQLF